MTSRKKPIPDSSIRWTAEEVASDIENFGSQKRVMVI
jgi:hypothetical protein